MSNFTDFQPSTKSLNGGQLAGLRNKIINGAMLVSQRGTSFSASSGQYTLDRWESTPNDAVGTSATITQSFANQDILGYGSNAVGVLRYSVTTVGTQAFIDLRQRIENVGTLQGKTVAVSFYARAGTVGKAVDVRFEQNFGAGGSGAVTTANFISISAVSTAAGFTRYSGTITLPSVAGQTVGANNHLALVVRLFTPNAGDFVDLTLVQVEEGSVATPFEHRPYGMELALCQRYYYRAAPGTSPLVFGVAYAQSATDGRCVGQFPVIMRTRPTALEQSGTATDYIIGTGGVDRTLSAVPAYNAVTTNATWVVNTTVASGQTAGQAGVMVTNSAAAYLGWSAEL